MLKKGFSSLVPDNFTAFFDEYYASQSPETLMAPRMVVPALITSARVRRGHVLGCWLSL
jgi:hypothetical protein